MREKKDNVTKTLELKKKQKSEFTFKITQINFIKNKLHEFINILNLSHTLL